MINRTEAWKTSNGECFIDKNKAYSAQIKILFNALPKAANRQITSMNLKKLADSVEKWLPLAREMTDKIKASPGDEKGVAIREFVKTVDEVEAWVDSARGLLEQQENEPDVETKRHIIGQE